MLKSLGSGDPAMMLWITALFSPFPPISSVTPTAPGYSLKEE